MDCIRLEAGVVGAPIVNQSDTAVRVVGGPPLVGVVAVAGGVTGGRGRRWVGWAWLSVHRLFVRRRRVAWGLVFGNAMAGVCLGIRDV